MKKSLVLLAALLLVAGLMVSCGDSGGSDDVEKAAQGTWKAVNPGASGFDIVMILGSDSYKYDIYNTGTLTQVDGHKGDLEASGGAFTSTTKFDWVGGAWVASSPVVVSNDSYVLNSSTSLTITADFDPGTPGKETVTFTKQ